MKQLVEYELDDGQTILVEVDLPEAGIERAGRLDQVVKAKERLGETLEQIKPLAQTVMAKLHGLSSDEIGVEFGIKLSAKAGIILASAESEANITVRLTWRKENHQTPTLSPNRASTNND